MDAAEEAELAELKALIGRSPERGSQLTQSAFKRFLVEEENRERATAARREKEERLRMRAELTAKRVQHAQGLKQAAKQQLEQDRAVQAATRERKLKVGRATRATEAAWEEERKKRAAARKAAGLQLVNATRERQKRMDKAEDEQDRLERAEGTAARKAVEEAYHAERQRIIERNRAKVKPPTWNHAIEPTRLKPPDWTHHTLSAPHSLDRELSALPSAPAARWRVSSHSALRAHAVLLPSVHC